MSEDRFGWHPESPLIGVLDEARSRGPLEEAGVAAWATALDYLFGQALHRAMGEPTGYGDLRRLYFGPSERPAEAPAEPAPLVDLLAEFTERLAPHQLNGWHPRALSYFTPPPLVASIVGELLAQWTTRASTSGTPDQSARSSRKR
jgi:hypothetical protein